MDPRDNAVGGADRWAESVEIYLTEFLTAEADKWTRRYPRLESGFERLSRFVLDGGKRIRPRFAYWGFVGAGGDPSDKRLMRVGAAIELQHAFALMHDDVMDGSSTRRRNPTIHRHFTSVHEANNWRGDSRRTGEGFAILLGDLAFAYSVQMLTGLPAELHALFDETRIELHVGQFLDLVCAADGSHDPALSTEIARLKTAKYTVERPLHAGATLADGQDLLGLFSTYGLAVGEAFQLRDDLLGVFGSPERTGKPVGEDIRSGKMTLLLEQARNSSGPSERELLAKVGTSDLSDAEVAEISVLLEQSGARQWVEDRIAELVDTAVAALDNSSLASEAKNGLIGMAQEAAFRSA